MKKTVTVEPNEAREIGKKMAEKVSKKLKLDLSELRLKPNEQLAIVEKERNVPPSIPVLPKFYKQGIITDDDLLEYARVTEVQNRMEYIKAGYTHKVVRIIGGEDEKR